MVVVVGRGAEFRVVAWSQNDRQRQSNVSGEKTVVRFVWNKIQYRITTDCHLIIIALKCPCRVNFTLPAFGGVGVGSAPWDCLVFLPLPTVRNPTKHRFSQLKCRICLAGGCKRRAKCALLWRICDFWIIALIRVILWSTGRWIQAWYGTFKVAFMRLWH